MKYRNLGTTDLKVSAIGLGGISLPTIPLEEAARVIRRALDLGVNFIDTARGYGDSESKIGVAIRERRGDCYVASKTFCRDYSGTLKDIKKSLKELEVNYIDLYQLHSVSSRKECEAVLEIGGASKALKYAKRKGWIGHAGVTCHRDIGVMKDLVESGDFETIMVAYNPLDQESVEGVVKLATDKGMGVIAMKPLCGGDLVTPPDSKKKHPDRIVIGSLRWVLSNKNISTVIPGMKSMRDVEEDVPVGDMRFELTEKEKKDIVTLIGELIGKFGKSFRYGQRCLRCYYCQPCPQGIIIPEVLRALDMFKGYPRNLKYMGTELYQSLEVKPDVCAECLSCIEKCPARLSIPEMLKQAFDILGAHMR